MAFTRACGFRLIRVNDSSAKAWQQGQLRAHISNCKQDPKDTLEMVLAF